MDKLKDLANLQLFFAFIVPGVITTYVRAQFLTGRTPSVKENVFELVVLSSIYYAVIIIFLEPILNSQGPRLYRDVAWIALILVGPTLFGILLGVVAQKDLLSRFAGSINLSLVHVIPTAWDWRFAAVQRGLFVMVTLTDGACVAGYFGGNSFASSDGEERDLYLEEEYEVDESGSWKPRLEKVGILITAKEIRYVEFWNS